MNLTNDIVVAENKTRLADEIKISVGTLKQDLSSWVIVKDWRVKEVELLTNRNRGSGL